VGRWTDRQTDGYMDARVNRQMICIDQAGERKRNPMT
jgi:hypothetical protein